MNIPSEREALVQIAITLDRIANILEGREQRLEDPRKPEVEAQIAETVQKAMAKPATKPAPKAKPEPAPKPAPAAKPEPAPEPATKDLLTQANEVGQHLLSTGRVEDLKRFLTEWNASRVSHLGPDGLKALIALVPL